MMMVQGRNTQQTAATVSNEFVSKQKPDAPAANFPKAEAQENPVVQVNISATGRKLSQTEKSAGPANAQLKQWDAQEADRQRKLEYMHSIEERLQNENLSEEDRKMLEEDVAWLKKETMTNRDRIEELKTNMKNMEKSYEEMDRKEWNAREAERQGKLEERMRSIEKRLQSENLSEEDRKMLEADATWLKIETTVSLNNSEDMDFSGHFNSQGYLKQIKAREEWQEMHDKEVRELTSLAHQENANLAAAEMKAAEADATPKETERQADDFAAAFADKESLQHLSDLLEAQNAAHANDDAETKEENAVVADDASASSGENVEEARKR